MKGDFIMRRKMYWGLGVLMILVIAGVCYMFAVQYAEINQLKKEAAEAEKLEKSMKQQSVGQTPIDYTKPPPGKTFANGGHWHNGEWHDAPHETNSKVPVGKFSHTNPPDASTASTHSLQKMRELKKRIDNINVRVQAKYPEFQDLALLTPEEIHARYPTDNDKLALAQKAEDFLDEFLLEIKEAFADAPIEIRKSVWNEIRPQLVSSLGEETADVMLTVVQDLFE